MNNLEEYILSSMIMDKQAMLKALSELNEDYFRKYKHVFKAIKETYEEHNEVDTGLLVSKGLELKTVSYLALQVSTSIYIDKYIAIAKERKYVDDCKIYATNILNANKFEEITKLVDQQPILGVRKNIITSKDGVRQSLLRLQERARKTNSLKGRKTGYELLDYMTGGLKDGEVILIEGKTNVGKSIFAQNIAMKMAKDNYVMWFGLEMTKSQLMDRLTMMYFKIYTSKNFNDPRTIKPFQDKKLAGFEDDGVFDNFVIAGMDELKHRTLSEIKAIAFNEMNKRKGKPSVIFIDYLRLIRGGNGEKAYERVQNNFEKIMDYAADLSVPIVLIVGQNKMGQTSGASEMLYDAHQHYVLERENVGAKLNVIKNRDGGKGEIEFAWLQDYLRFEVMD